MDMDMLEYVLDAGRECECCPLSGLGCKGLTFGPNGPIFPKCADNDFADLLIPEEVERIYKEDHEE